MGIVETILISFMLVAFVGAMWVGLVEIFYSACVEDNNRWLIVDAARFVARLVK